MADVDISEDEYRRWTPIQNVLSIVVGPSRDYGLAADAVAQRLRAGLLHAAAEHFVRDGRPGDRADFVRVPPAHWEPAWVGNWTSPFWNTGQLQVTIERRSYSDRTATYFGIRVDPAELAKMLPEPEQSPVPLQPLSTDAILARYGYPIVADPQVEQPEDVRQPPISEATLKKWCEMCMTIRAPDQWNADSMRTFFEQCFPEKSVSRERLRKVREPPRSGPKPKSAE